MSFAFSAKTDPSLSFALLIGDKRKEPRKVWDSPAAIALLNKSAGLDGMAARRAVLDQLNSLFMREVPAVVLYSSTRIVAVRDTVSGFRIWPAAQTRLWNVGLSGVKPGA
jgi:peptide/nickel transport system substrate-binding protein